MNTEELNYVDIQIGDGKEVQKGALLIVHYDGYLDDGSKFDSSIDKGRPFQFVFGTGRVIKGWDLGLIGMKVGGVRKLFVPSQLAYGERQIGNLIKPHSNLSFTIELIDVLTRDE
jgi:peptidylprolyl isomerase